MDTRIEFYKDEYPEVNITKHTEDSHWKTKKIIKIIGDRLMPKVIFDFGCGAGLVAKAMSKYYPEALVLGLDISTKMMEAENDVIKSRVNFINSDINHVPFRNHVSDVILLIDILEHLEDPLEVLVRLKTITKYIVVKVPLEDSIWYWMNDIIGRSTRKEYESKLGHIQCYNVKSISKTIAQGGFHILKTDIISQNLDNPHNPHISRLGVFINPLRRITYKISKRVFARIFNGSAIILARSEYANK